MNETELKLSLGILESANTVDKQPYSTPHLSNLGSIAELTKGAGTVIDDAGGGFEAFTN